MNKTKYLLMFSIILFTGWMIFFQGTQPASSSPLMGFTLTPTDPVPTNTPVVPTNTPVIPTNTPAIPTNTPVVPTNTPVVPTNTPGRTDQHSGRSDQYTVRSDPHTDNTCGQYGAASARTNTLYHPCNRYRPHRKPGRPDQPGIGSCCLWVNRCRSENAEAVTSSQ